MTNDPRTHAFLPSEQFIGWRLDAVATSTRCAELIRMLAARGFEATNARYPDNYRNNDRLMFDDVELAAWLFAEVHARLPQTLDIDGERWTLVGLNKRFRACRYEHGQSFCIHRDGPYAPEPSVRSHLTLQLYLDDDPARAGGNTRFYADPRGETLWASLAPGVGTAIVFDHRAWHDGEAVTEGVKHVLRTDVMYRRTASATKHPSTDDRVLYRHGGYAWHAIVCRNDEIASAGRDGTVRRWSGSATATIELGAGSVTRIVEAADGRLWCGTRTGSLFVIEGLRAAPVARETGAILGLAARPDGGIVASTALGELVAFERNGSCAWRVRAHDGWGWTVIPDGTGYLSAGHGGQIVAVDDAGHLTPIARLPASIRALAATNDELWCGDTDGVLHCLARTGEVRSTIAAHRGAITGVIVRRDGRVVSCSEDGTVREWSNATCTLTFPAGDFVTSVAEGRGRELICASYDGAIYRQRPID